jgi:hypothetical protein
MEKFAGRRSIARATDATISAITDHNGERYADSSSVGTDCVGSSGCDVHHDVASKNHFAFEITEDADQAKFKPIQHNCDAARRSSGHERSKIRKESGLGFFDCSETVAVFGKTHFNFAGGGAGLGGFVERKLRR